MAAAKKTGIAAMAAKQKSATQADMKVVQGPDVTPEDVTNERASQKNSRKGRNIQKSVFVTKEMNRALLLAKADYEMTYDAIINEALTMWLAKKGAKTSE